VNVNTCLCEFNAHLGLVLTCLCYCKMVDQHSMQFRLVT